MVKLHLLDLIVKYAMVRIVMKVEMDTDCLRVDGNMMASRRLRAVAVDMARMEEAVVVVVVVAVIDLHIRRTLVSMHFPHYCISAVDHPAADMMIEVVVHACFRKMDTVSRTHRAKAAYSSSNSRHHH